MNKRESLQEDLNIKLMDLNSSVTFLAKKVISDEIINLMEDIAEFDKDLIKTHHWRYDREKRFYIFTCVECGINGISTINMYTPSVLKPPFLSCQDTKLRNMLK